MKMSPENGAEFVYECIRMGALVFIWGVMLWVVAVINGWW
jgi:hypothetical protein